MTADIGLAGFADVHDHPAPSGPSLLRTVIRRPSDSTRRSGRV